MVGPGGRQRTRGGAVGINPIIYAAVSLRFADADPLDRRLAALLGRSSAAALQRRLQGGRAFGRYRRAGGLRRSPLPDFYVGAHAVTDGLTLITRDVGAIAPTSRP